MRIPAIILAAGASRRLGQPKQLIRIAGEALLARTIRISLVSGADPVFVVLGANRESIAATVDLSKVQRVINEDWEQGIASSIRAGITAVQLHMREPRAVLLMVCDQPLLTAEHLRSLTAACERAGEPTIVASQYAETMGIPAIFPATLFAELMSLTGDRGAREILRNPDCPIIQVPFEGGEIDIDTPSDLTAIDA